MKIRKFKFKQILKLHLLKSKVYEHYEKKNNSSYLTDVSLSNVVTNFKKALQIIFQYHKTGKLILFVGLPQQLELKVNEATNHVAVPSHFNLQGVIFNTNTPNSFKFKKSLTKSHPLALLPKLSKKPDLVVLFSHYKQESVISESYVAKVPLILFDDDAMTSSKVWSNYNVSGLKSELSSLNQKNILFFGLNFLFRKFK